MEFPDFLLRFYNLGITLLDKENVNGISLPPPPAGVLQFGSPNNWHCEDVNEISGPLPRRGFTIWESKFLA